MKCPNCEVPLVISERQQVEIDYCPQCRGVWLDRGELDKLIERSETRDYDRNRGVDRRREDYPRKKKREGFLGELFDF